MDSFAGWGDWFSSQFGLVQTIKKNTLPVYSPWGLGDVPFGEEGNYCAPLVRMNAKRPLNDNLTQEMQTGLMHI